MNVNARQALRTSPWDLMLFVPPGQPLEISSLPTAIRQTVPRNYKTRYGGTSHCDTSALPTCNSSPVQHAQILMYRYRTEYKIVLGGEMLQVMVHDYKVPDPLLLVEFWLVGCHVRSVEDKTAWGGFLRPLTEKCLRFGRSIHNWNSN